MKILNTLTRRVMLWFVLVGLLPLMVLGYLTLRFNEQSLRDTALQNLSQLADKKALQIRGYLTERIADTRLIARSVVTSDAITQLSRSYYSAHPGTLEYQKVDKRYRDYFERYTDDTAMFYDVFLIDLQGDIVYTQKHEKDFATNLLVGPYRDSGLSDAFLESRLTLESAASTFEFYEPSQAMASFVAIPVIREGRLLGVIAFQLNIAQIQQVAADPIGLGTSGETVLARWVDQQQVMIVSPLKGKSENTLLVELNMLQPVDFSKMPNPMHRALSGIHGSGIETDYRTTGGSCVALSAGYALGDGGQDGCRRGFRVPAPATRFFPDGIVCGNAVRVRCRVLFRQEAGGSAPGIGARRGRCGARESGATGE